MTLYFTVLNSFPSVILGSSRSFNFCSNLLLIQLKYWFLIKQTVTQQAVFTFDYTLVDVLFVSMLSFLIFHPVFALMLSIIILTEKESKILIWSETIFLLSLNCT